MLDLQELLGGAVSSLPFEFTCDTKGLSSDVISGTVEAKGEIRNFSGYIVLNAEVSLKAQVICARCGNSFDTVFSFNTKQKLTDKLENKDNDEFILIENGRFDVSEYVRSSMLLEKPAKFLCSEDCKGLCPKCGKNLNESPCSCDKRDIDPRLAVLAKYFDK